MSATGRRKNTSTSKKRKTSTRKTSRAKGGKVYIPPYKAMILCLSVIVVCVILLLVSTLTKPKAATEKEEQAQASSITQRFEEPQEKHIEEHFDKLSDPTNKKSDRENKTGPSTELRDPKSKSGPSTEHRDPENKKSERDDKASPSTELRDRTDDNREPKSEKKKEPAAFGFEKAKNGAQLCFVFDDGGQNLEQLKKFLALPFPITVAVLPQITHSVEAADMVRKSGNELILHQPMQSVNASINPGPGAITPDMTDDQIVSQLFVNINQIGPVAGMNNHEGSGITADAEKMAVVLQLASDEGIYFLDSRTNVETQVPYVAGELGYTYFERNIFLDNEKTRANALSELKKGLALANKNGSVIMIGHIWSADFLPQLLTEAYPELKAQGYTFSIVSSSKARKN